MRLACRLGAYALESNTRGAAGTYQKQTEKIVVLPGLTILAPPRVYALCLGTGGTALFTALVKDNWLIRVKKKRFEFKELEARMKGKKIGADEQEQK
ncbi:hypothetical protein EVAR_89280_1 [Eumeta japonica]|uniref:Uncharacterized protein n=1 Tax=Eumeta variegata TaxID=151549 RepID=A0A4C1VIX7_EUMVA|nr:hypothetical protein EVAR_89280_1 [Eumeta japonica]